MTVTATCSTICASKSHAFSEDSSKVCQSQPTRTSLTSQMAAESQQLANFVSSETGLACEVEDGVNSQGDPWYLLRPAGVPADHAFAVRATMRWRRVVVVFEPGIFAGDLLAAMGDADSTGRASFRSVLAECSVRGADIVFRVNGQPCDPQTEETWPARWSRVSLSLQSRIDPEVHDGEQPLHVTLDWSRLFVAAVLALLPVQPEEAEEQPPAVGYAEGGATTSQSTRYERDRRNRAAAIAIWGCKCRACGLDFGQRYGDPAKGFIEVHHTTPVSVLEPGTVVNPARDLVPLCPNCHAVAHRREPPFTVDEIRTMLAASE